MRDNLLKLRQILTEIVQNFFSLDGIGISYMFFDHFLQFKNIIFGSNFIGRNHFLVSFGIQIVILVQYISNTAAHTCSKVLAYRTDYNHTATGHVLTAVITDTLDYGNSTGITYTETFSCHTVDKCLTGGCSIQCHITDNNIFILFEFGTLRRIYD